MQRDFEKARGRRFVHRTTTPAGLARAMFLIALLLAAACSEQSAHDGTGDSSPEYVLQPEAVVLGDAAGAALLAVEADGTLRFRSEDGVEALRPGQVLLSYPVPAAPGGLLRRALTVQKANGEVLITTRQATLREAFKELHVSYKGELTAFPEGATGTTGQISSPLRWQPDGWSKSFEEKIPIPGGNITAKGSVLVKPYVELWADLDVWDADVDVRMVAGLNEHAEVSVDANAKWSDQYTFGILEHSFPPVCIPGVPVCFTPKLKLSGKLSAEASGTFQFGAVQDMVAQAGFECIEGCADLSSFDHSFIRKGPTYSAKLTGRAELIGTLAVVLYDEVPLTDLSLGSAEATLRIGPKVVAGVNPSEADPLDPQVEWRVSGCLNGEVKVASTILGLQKTFPIFPVDSKCVTLFEERFQAPTIALEAPVATSRLFKGESVALRGWGYHHDAGVTCHWSSSVATDVMPADTTGPAGARLACDGVAILGSVGERTITLTVAGEGQSAKQSVNVFVIEKPAVYATITSPRSGEIVVTDWDRPITVTGSVDGIVGDTFEWEMVYPTDEYGVPQPDPLGISVYEVPTEGESVTWTPFHVRGYPTQYGTLYTPDPFSLHDPPRYGRITLHVKGTGGEAATNSVVVLFQKQIVIP